VVAPLIAAMNVEHRGNSSVLIGPPARIGVPAIDPVAELRSSDRFVRMQAIETLGKIETPRALNTFIAATKDLGPKDREIAIPGMRNRMDPQVADFLIASLREPEPEVRSIAAWVLVGKNAIQAEDVLIAALSDPDAHVIAVLKGPDSRSRSLAAEALVHIVYSRAMLNAMDPPTPEA